MGRATENETKPESGLGVYYHAVRYVVLILATGCLTFCLGNPLILNFTVICMDEIVPPEQLAPNGTAFMDDGDVHWLLSGSRRNLLFSAVAIGNLIGTAPMTYILQNYGTRMMMMMYGATSIVATAFFPFAVDINYYPLIFAVRVFQGIAMAANLPGCGAVCSSWAPLKEGGMYMSILSMQFQFCAIVAMPVSGVMCVSPIGWKGAFWFQAAMSFIFFAAFFYFYRDSPRTHRSVSSKELNLIMVGREDVDMRGSVPILAIMKTPAIIGSWIASIGGNIGFYILLQFGPTYLNKVLHYEITATGIATALPYILAALLKLFTGPISDHATCLSEKGRIIMFTSISQGCMAFCFLVMALSSIATLSQFCYTLAIVFSGVNVIGLVRCGQLVARQYMSFVLSVTNAIACVINLMLPPLIANVADSNRPEQWSFIFYVTVGIIIATNAYFMFVATAEPAPWTKPDFQRNCPSKVVPVLELGSADDKLEKKNSVTVAA